MPIIQPFKGIMPKIHETAYIAEGVVIIGDVTIDAQTSIWPGCMLRADINVIRIGKRVNIQDGSVLHVTPGSQGVVIGDDVTVGHMALLHECVLEDKSFVGMKACLMDRSKIETHGMLAAGGLLTAGKTIPSGQLWGGSPARYMRDLTKDEYAMIDDRAADYVKLMNEYL